MLSVLLRKAMPGHAAILTKISQAAFDRDIRNRPDLCGPEGYDSLSYQEEHIRKGFYYLIESEGHIAGGLLLRKTESPDHIHVHRVFTDPDCQGRGIGTQAFVLAESLYPEVTTWTLDTPSWALGNHRFYESLGYEKQNEFHLESLPFALFFYIKKT